MLARSVLPSASVGQPGGRFLRAQDGPRVAVLEVSGWRSHASQGAMADPLAKILAQLDNGLRSPFKALLGESWPVSAAALDQRIFPASAGSPPMARLLRA